MTKEKAKKEQAIKKGPSEKKTEKKKEKNAGYKKEKSAGNKKENSAGYKKEKNAGYKKEKSAGYKKEKNAGNKKEKSAGYKKEKSASEWERLSQRVSAEPMLDDIQPNKQSLSYHLSLGVEDVVAAEDVDLAVMEDFVGFLLVHNDILNASRAVGMESDILLVEFFAILAFGSNR